MKRSVILVLCLLILSGWSSAIIAQAQSNSGIEQLEVALWPDYDRQSTLVIYRVRLASSTTLPAEVPLPIPATVGDPYAAAWMGEDGQLLLAEYTIEAQGDWSIVTLTTGSFVAQLEFYLDYEVSGSTRTLLFTWPSGFGVENLSYEVQQPAGAENFQVIPAPDKSVTGKDGLLYLEANLGQAMGDQSVQIELSYSNPTELLSVDTFVSPEPMPRSSPVAAEGGTPDILQILPWFLGGLGVCLVALGGILYIQSRRKPQRARRKPQTLAQPRAAKRDTKAGVDPSTIYCHQCGTKVGVSDRFCRHCGAPLRR
jgi:hypothetical protein